MDGARRHCLSLSLSLFNSEERHEFRTREAGCKAVQFLFHLGVLCVLRGYPVLRGDCDRMDGGVP